MNDVEPVPSDFPVLTAHLTVGDALASLEFYKTAFGAEEKMRLVMPDGRVGHAQMQIGDGGIFMLASAFPEMGFPGLQSDQVSPVTVHLYVADVDGFFVQAEKAGAIVVRRVETHFYGDRSGRLQDPFGHQWNVATRVKNVPDEDLQRLMDKAYSSNAQ